MKPNRILIALPLLLGVSTSSYANPIAGVGTSLGSSLGSNFFFNNASTGGTDAGVNEPASAIFTRSFGTLSVGASGTTINITGLAWASLGSSAANDATSASVTITYLGTDGVFGGGDDVVIGSTTDTFTYAGAGNVYAWTFTTPMSAVINGTNNQFRIVITPTNGTATGSLSFKNSSGTTIGATTKLSAAGTSVAIDPFPDTDADGIADIHETNTGIYVSPTNTGTNPAVADTDADGYLDGVETNTNTFVNVGNTGTSPLKNDSDNDGLLDGVENNSGTFVSVSNTGTSPVNRDKDNDRLSDKYEVDNGLNAHANADFDADTYTDALEVLFYNSDPKNVASLPGVGASPAPGSFTPILDGTATPVLGSTLVNAIVNEAALGGGDASYTGGVTDFVVKYPNAFPAAASTVSITGFAWPVTAANNASGDILLQFFDPGADGVIDGIDKDTLVGTAKGTLTVTGASTIMYWNFTPINFTSAGTALMVKIQSTAAMNHKTHISAADGQWFTNSGVTQFSPVRESAFSIGGTATAPGGYPAWKDANNTTQTSDLDHDNDGVSNGVEHFLGGSASTTGFTPLPGATGPSNALTITWTKAATGYNGVYLTDFFVETSTSLTGAWAMASLGAGPDKVVINGNEVTYTFPTTGTKNFARLKVLTNP